MSYCSWLFPLCGEGTRVRQLGLYKPLIEVNKLTVIEHFLSTICHNFSSTDSFYFVIRKDHSERFDAQNKIQQIAKKYINHHCIHFIVLPKPTLSPVETIRYALQHIKNIRSDQPVCIANADQKIDILLPSELSKNSIYLSLNFECTGKSSYVQLDENMQISDIQEKVLISAYASTGIYLFSDINLLRRALDNTPNVLHGKESCVSNLVSFLISCGITAYPIETFCKYDFGNEKIIKHFELLSCSNNINSSSID